MRVSLHVENIKNTNDKIEQRRLKISGKLVFRFANKKSQYEARNCSEIGKYNFLYKEDFFERKVHR